MFLSKKTTRQSLNHAVYTFLLAACITSCSSIEPSTNNVLLHSQAPPAQPFTLKILDELNDGTNFHLRGRVIAKARWDLSQAVVRLTGIKNGQVVNTTHSPLLPFVKSENSISYTRHHPPQDFTFSLSIPSNTITDYQLELLWGAEARGYIAKKEKYSPNALQLRNVKTERRLRCTKTPCQVAYRITGELINAGTTPINSATLGVGFVDRTLQATQPFSAPIPNNETEVVMAEVALAPGASRLIKLDLDQTISEDEEKKYKPVVRVVRSH